MPSSSSPCREPLLKTDERVIQGLAVSPGLAMGPAYLHLDIWERAISQPSIPPQTVDSELARICAAFQTVRDRLQLSTTRARQKLGPELSGIFEAHQCMLQDPALLPVIQKKIREELFSAEEAVRTVFQAIQEKFLTINAPGLRESAADLTDLARQILRALHGITNHGLEKIQPGSILVAQRILPSELVFLKEGSAAGIVVEEGGLGSHCSLLARGLGIPQISQTPKITEQVMTGDLLLLNSQDGTVTLTPDEITTKSFSTKLRQHQQEHQESASQAQAPALTACGRHITVSANISNARDALTAAENGAGGIGLFRIEGLYLRSPLLLSEEELYAELDTALTPFLGKPVVVRLLDAGGDKAIPALKQAPEDNPFLGLRGIRLLLDHPGLLFSELRTLLRLSQTHELKILIPMVTDLSDISAVKQALQTCASELGITDLPPLGAMIETPAAALMTAEICAEVDFLSIGSNDLTQYIMAAARGNPLVNRYYQDKHPAVLRMIGQVCATARLSQTPVSLCGSLAAWEDSIPRLLDLGLTSLSVAPPLIPTVKKCLRTCTIQSL
ncbi:phosphoenolpyruvate--protein phosphotransferase [Verrucomicrobiaceae bacterium 227]